MEIKDQLFTPVYLTTFNRFYQYLDSDSLIRFLETNTISRKLADAFISGEDSERQTAGVKSTLASALKHIRIQRIFYATFC
ncbi:hypothetical protein [Leeuwenhoekiella marinoflava]|uniref:hypothetical protein n=1 Tax=Leeuwenhoekiella marinoflava TaxID=988 RepID=UPI0030038A75